MNVKFPARVSPASRRVAGVGSVGSFTSGAYTANDCLSCLTCPWCESCSQCPADLFGYKGPLDYRQEVLAADKKGETDTGGLSFGTKAVIGISISLIVVGVIVLKR